MVPQITIMLFSAYLVDECGISIEISAQFHLQLNYALILPL
jgi:hypothetical protein